MDNTAVTMRAYCEIPGEKRVKIRKVKRRDLSLSEGRPGLDPRGGESANPMSFLLSATWAGGYLSRDNCMIAFHLVTESSGRRKPEVSRQLRSDRKVGC